MEKIIVEVSDVWQYFNDQKNALKSNLCLLACNKEYGVEIYITETMGAPFFSVTADGYQLAEDSATTEEECVEAVQKLYDKYLTGKFIDDENLPFNELSEEDTSCLEIEDMISERETELDDAVMYLVNIAAEDDESLFGENYDDIIEDAKEHFLEYLARKHGLKIRRPMMLEDEDEDGEEFFEEYPYECMVFEDEDNPIYKNR